MERKQGKVNKASKARQKNKQAEKGNASKQDKQRRKGKQGRHRIRTESKQAKKKERDAFSSAATLETRKHNNNIKTIYIYFAAMLE